jgi:hypothetical protein
LASPSDNPITGRLAAGREAARVETVLDPSLTTGVRATDAAALAARHRAANVNALKAADPDFVPPPVLNMTWLFARDGALTAMTEGDRWWAGCSVPLAAARFMLKTMDVRGTVGCFLHPAHAAQIRVALDRLHSRQAIVAIVPEPEAFAAMLYAQDFSRDIAAGRLWFAAGPEWQDELHALFERNPGLPTPIEFIRPILADSSAADVLIEPAQTVFAKVSSHRTNRVQSLHSAWQPQDRHARRVCLLAGSEFRLWDDAGLVLAELGSGNSGIDVRRVDPDRPTSASPLALADAAAECDAVVAANCFRSDLPGITPAEQPWVTWVTTARIPPAADAGPNDRLLLADAAFRPIADRQGWADHRIQLVGWPAAQREAPDEGQEGSMLRSTIVFPSPGTPREGWGGGDSPVGRRSLLPHPPTECRGRGISAGCAAGDRPGRSYLAIIADTHPLDPPKQLSDYSSQLVLWDVIREELARDPFLAVEEMGQYLKTRRSRLQIGDAGFDAAMFVDQLIIPAIHQGMAALLIRTGLPVNLFGRGWDQIEGLAGHHRGIVTSRGELGRILEESAAIVHVWPWQPGHPVEFAGRPVLRSSSAAALVRDARAALSGGIPLPPQAARPISAEHLAMTLNHISPRHNGLSV